MCAVTKTFASRYPISLHYLLLGSATAESFWENLEVILYVRMYSAMCSPESAYRFFPLNQSLLFVPNYQGRKCQESHHDLDHHVEAVGTDDCHAVADVVMKYDGHYCYCCNLVSLLFFSCRTQRGRRLKTDTSPEQRVFVQSSL